MVYNTLEHRPMFKTYDIFAASRSRRRGNNNGRERFTYRYQSAVMVTPPVMAEVYYQFKSYLNVMFFNLCLCVCVCVNPTIPTYCEVVLDCPTFYRENVTYI